MKAIIFVSYRYEKKQEIAEHRKNCEDMSSDLESLNEKLKQLGLENETNVSECNLKKK